MKIKSTLISALLLVASTTFAQKPDKESLGFRTVRDYPTLNIRAGVKTFSILNENSVQAPLSTDLGSAFNFSSKGVKFINNPQQAELIFKVSNVQETMSDIIILDDRHKIVKGPNGKPMKPVPKTAPDGTIIREYQGQVSKSVKFDYAIILDKKEVYKSTYENSVDLETEWIADSKVARAKIANMAKSFGMLTGANEIAADLKKLSGTQLLVTIKLDIYGVKQKKKCLHDYSAINNSVLKFKAASEYLEKDEFNTEPFKKDVKEVIALWESLLKESNLTNEEAKINAEITAALYYNIAIYNVLIKEFQSAQDYFRLSEKADNGFGDAKAMAELADRWNTAKKKYEERMAKQQ